MYKQILDINSQPKLNDFSKDTLITDHFLLEMHLHQPIGWSLLFLRHPAGCGKRCHGRYQQQTTMWKGGGLLRISPFHQLIV